MLKSFCVLFFVSMNLQFSNGLFFENYENHHCNRQCTENEPKRECSYDFIVEWFMVNSRDCLNCNATNHNDCFRSKCITADGHTRPVSVVNRMLPGPKIQVCKNDEIIVNVKNMLNSFESTTIHWHGIKQNKSQHMDGIGMFTQCPIMPNTKFQYKFKAQDRGTHMWHAHSASQRAEGLFGALIVRESNDVHAHLYDFDLSEHVIVLNDWTKDILLQKFNKFLHHLEGDENIDSILINGRGVDPNNEVTPRAIFKVKHGKRYRFRTMNTGAQFCPLEFSINEHKLKVISTDGNPVEPTLVRSFILFPGERVDFVLEATKKPNKTYWIKVKGHADCEDSKIYQTAILMYDDSDATNLNSIQLPNEKITYENSGRTPCPGLTLNPSNLKITHHTAKQFISIDSLRSAQDSESIYQVDKINKKVDKKIYLTIGMNAVLNPQIYDNQTFMQAQANPNIMWPSPQINNISFHLPPTPFFYQQKKVPKEMYCNEDKLAAACLNNSDSFCSCIHMYEIKLNDVVELVITDVGSEDGPENHPIHLHGNYFAVLGMDKLGNTITAEEIKELDDQGKLNRNLNNPPFKDTVQVPSGGYTIIRFHASNPGYWLFHCHVQFHSETGMAVIFKVGKSCDLPKKPDNWPQCSDFENN